MNVDFSESELIAIGGLLLTLAKSLGESHQCVGAWPAVEEKVTKALGVKSLWWSVYEKASATRDDGGEDGKDNR